MTYPQQPGPAGPPPPPYQPAWQPPPPRQPRRSKGVRRYNLIVFNFALVIAVGLLIASISSYHSTTTASSDPAPTEATSADITRAAQEAVFMQAAANGDPADLAGVEQSVLVSEGRDICSMLTSGQSVADVIARERLGFSAKETGALIGASPALCPSQQAKVTAGIAALP